MGGIGKSFWMCRELPLQTFENLQIIGKFRTRMRLKSGSNAIATKLTAIFFQPGLSIGTCIAVAIAAPLVKATAIRIPTVAMD